MDYAKCSHENCANPALTRGLCSPHYQQGYHGRPAGPVVQQTIVPCKHCAERPATLKGCCRPCYTRFEFNPKPCKEPGCTGLAAKRGWCEAHVPVKARAVAEENPRAGNWVGWHTGLGSRVCQLDHCDKAAYSTGLCPSHTSRARRFNMTIETALVLLNQRTCDACGDEASTRDFCIDHDHACCPGTNTCGECVRGVLCGPCNTALGFARDDKARLESLVSYLGRSGK